jgi:dTDP-4-amino-4,6-dideoxygalactose transaminase
MKIPPTKPYFPEWGIEFILDKFRDILSGKGFLSQHKYCEEFEKRFAEYTGARYAVTTNSGTSAIEAILRSLNIQGKDIIVTTNTFAATVFAIIGAGGKPVFADITSDMTLNPDEVRRKITPQTKAVVTVHIGGLMSPHTEEIREICDENNLYLVEDAAHAHGSTLNNKKAGKFGIAGAYSFFSTKIMTTAEGGMVITDDKDIYDTVKVIKDQAKIRKDDYQNYHETLGYNWRMTEIQALMGLVQLKMLEDFVRRRNEIARIYNEELSYLDGATILKPPKNVRHNYYKYLVILHNHDRVKVAQKMKQDYGISLGGYVYEIPLHQQPAFKVYASERLPIAEELCSKHISLPIFYEMTDEQAVYVAKSLKKVIG